MNEFEEMMKEAITESYIKVMGIEKYNSLTDQDKDNLLHIMVNGFVKPIVEKDLEARA